jgi:hypothetical protein
MLQGLWDPRRRRKICDRALLAVLVRVDTLAGSLEALTVNNRSKGRE